MAKKKETTHKYRLRPGFSHYEWDKGSRVRCGAGSIIEMTEARAAGMSDRFELVVRDSKPAPVAKPAPVETEPEATPTTKEPPADKGDSGDGDSASEGGWTASLESLNVGQVGELLEGIDDTDVLSEIEVAELAGQGRPGVAKLIAARVKALKA